MFERKDATNFRNSVLPEIQAVLEKHGLAGTIGSISYGPNMRMTFTLVSLETAEAKKIDPKAEFEALATRYGYDPKWFGAKVKLSGSLFEIVGVRTGSSGNVKNCIRVRRVSTGKEFITSVSTVRCAIA